MVDASRLFDLLVGGTGQAAQSSSWPAPAAEAGQSPDVFERAKGFLQNHGGSIAGGVAAGAITNLLLGSKLGREIGGEALKLGAAAVIGGLAYRAYNNYRDGKAPMADGSPQPVPAVPTTSAVSNEHALVLIRAMIAAALSDGALDSTERERIQGRLSAVGLGSEELRFLEQEIARPWSPAQLAAAVSSPQARSEIYLASLVAIEADTEAERAYLRYLAATLGLDDALVAHLDEAARAATGPAPESTPRKLASG